MKFIPASLVFVLVLLARQADAEPSECAILIRQYTDCVSQQRNLSLPESEKVLRQTAPQWANIADRKTRFLTAMNFVFEASKRSCENYRSELAQKISAAHLAEIDDALPDLFKLQSAKAFLESIQK